MDKLFLDRIDVSASPQMLADGMKIG